MQKEINGVVIKTIDGKAFGYIIFVDGKAAESSGMKFPTAAAAGAEKDQHVKNYEVN